MSVIDFVVAAEFDIDLGPTITAQYPNSSISGSLPYFTELLLPDQVHNRKEDWSIVILHHDKDIEGYKYFGTQYDDNKTFLLNLVNTRFDEKVRRNTIIRSLAVATKLTSFYIFKPLLLIALDDLFRTNDPSTVSKKLYDAINTSFNIPIPKMAPTEKILLDCAFDYDERSTSPDQIKVPKKKNPVIEINVKYNEVVLPIKLPLLQESENLQETSLALLTQKLISAKVFIQSNGHLENKYDIPNFVVAKSSDFVHGSSFSSKFSYSSAAFSTPETNTPAIFMVLNAILGRKRVFIFGNKRSANEICQCVFGILTLASGGGLLRGFLQKTLPYVDLSKLSVIRSLDWYIAGTANPAFKLHSTLWDVMYDMEHNQVIVHDNELEFGVAYKRRDSMSVAWGTQSVNFMKNLQLIINEKHDDSTTLMVWRQFINELMCDKCAGKSMMSIQSVRPSSPIQISPVDDFFQKSDTYQQLSAHTSTSMTTSPCPSPLKKKSSYATESSRHSKSMSMSSLASSMMAVSSKHSSVTTTESHSTGRGRKLSINTKLANDIINEKDIKHADDSHTTTKAASHANGTEVKESIDYIFEDDFKTAGLLNILILLHSDDISNVERLLEIYRAISYYLDYDVNKFLIITYLMSFKIDPCCRNVIIDQLGLGLYHSNSSVQEAARKIFVSIKNYSPLTHDILQTNMNPFLQMAL